MGSILNVGVDITMDTKTTLKMVVLIIAVAILAGIVGKIAFKAA